MLKLATSISKLATSILNLATSILKLAPSIPNWTLQFSSLPLQFPIGHFNYQVGYFNSHVGHFNSQFDHFNSQWDTSILKLAITRLDYKLSLPTVLVSWLAHCAGQPLFTSLQKPDTWSDFSIFSDCLFTFNPCHRKCGEKRGVGMRCEGRGGGGLSSFFLCLQYPSCRSFVSPLNNWSFLLPL